MILNQKDKRTELLAPAGDLTTAIRAYEAGADAVYVGYKEFSARGHAKNFTLLDLQRLKGYAHQHGKAFYVALNTLVTDSELSSLIAFLKNLELLEPNAVIVQDLGVAGLIFKHFPSLTLYASTQMAVHNSAGLAMATEMGIRRVILSRELTLDDIKRLRAQHSDIELEVFIHGALCYSFSGLCLASGLLLSRSGNRGQCAQICRNYFMVGKERQFCFSCNDLFYAHHVLKLKEIGVNSFKIEGRLKTAEYVVAAVLLYRRILDCADATQTSKANENDSLLLDKARLTFARKATTGYLYSRHGDDLIDPSYAGHRGIFLGVVKDYQQPFVTVDLNYPLKRNDTLLCLTPKKACTEQRFNAFEIKNSSHKNVQELKRGQLALIRADFACTRGQELYLINSNSGKKEKKIDLKTIPKFGPRFKAQFVVDEKSICISARFLDDVDVSCALDVAVSASKDRKSLEGPVRQMFAVLGDLPFYLDLDIINQTPWEFPFVPLSLLKKIKVCFLNKLKGRFDDVVADKIKTTLPSVCVGQGPASSIREFGVRSKLSPHHHSRIPFADADDFKDPEFFFSLHNDRYVPLCPVLRDEASYFAGLKDMIADNAQTSFVLGLNNVHHIYYARQLATNDNVSFFIDVYLYAANRFSLTLYHQLIPRLRFAYFWPEGTRAEFESLRDVSPIPLVNMSDRQTLPLFISYGCLKKQPVCPKNCLGKDRFTVKNAGQSFEVLIDNCVAYVFSVDPLTVPS
ncbi:MAG: U32 family peptidase [Deltaproteobacteria bacterium]|nr:U32 family peptidase [Deltaproteobacteria bacterium]